MPANLVDRVRCYQPLDGAEAHPWLQRFERNKLFPQQKILSKAMTRS